MELAIFCVNYIKVIDFTQIVILSNSLQWITLLILNLHNNYNFPENENVCVQTSVINIHHHVERSNIISWWNSVEILQNA